jgi:3-hexulose-6-phosphate synthase/6-phospho-3-hexuloisomerase
MAAKLQLALDYTILKRALQTADLAVKACPEIILEAGTPLIKSEGLQSVRELKKRFPESTIVADMKIMDAGKTEVEYAAKAGAHIVVVLGVSGEATIRECVEAGRNYGATICVDMLNLPEVLEQAKRFEEWGVDMLSVHTPIDLQMRGHSPFEELKSFRQVVSIPISVAGGINSETAADAVAHGADVVIVGGAITKAKDVARATADIVKAIQTGQKVATTLFKRKGLEDIREILSQVSAANLSDAMHRGGVLSGMHPICEGARLIGPAVTVRTFPGDFAKPVEAIDVAKEGEVIVIDQGGVGPACWGELATESAVRKKLGGVVVDGAIRDTEEIRRLKFPAFGRLVTPHAGEPKGFGEINVPVKISGVTVRPGDWLFGDRDGLLAIPKEKIVEIANRGMDVLEQENRIREEIRSGSTLSQVLELLRWEKK